MSRSVTFSLAVRLAAIAAAVSGCVETPSFALREKIQSSWTHPEADAGPGEVVITLFRAKDDKLYFPLAINGRDVKVVFDTGSRTIFDRKMLRAPGVATDPSRDSDYGFGGYLRAHVAFVDEIALGGLKIVGKSVTVIDLSALKWTQIAAALPQIDGLLGADLRAPLSAWIGYEALALTLRKPRAPER